MLDMLESDLGGHQLVSWPAHRGSAERGVFVPGIRGVAEMEGG